MSDIHESIRCHANEYLKKAFSQNHSSSDTGFGRHAVTVLMAADIQSMWKLHNVIHADLVDKNLYLTRDLQHFSDLLHVDCNNTFFLGVWDSNELISYSGLSLLDDRHEELQKLLLSQGKLNARTAYMEDAVVHPVYRGAGIQRILNKHKVNIAEEYGLTRQVTIVSPINAASLSSLLRNGFYGEIYTKIYGSPRFVLVRQAGQCAASTHKPQRVISPTDENLISSSLNEGWKVFECAKSNSSDEFMLHLMQS
jgi:ribosomal protein S18 acetylase RimI-like enzyme